MKKISFIFSAIALLFLVPACANGQATGTSSVDTDKGMTTDKNQEESVENDTGQPQNYSILSAYHGLDQLPVVAGLLCGYRVANDDGMPVVFSTQLQVDSVVPESFLVIRSDGERVVPNCATLHPATEPLEQRTVLLTGDFGTFGETPLRVEVTGPLLTFDGESLLGLSTENITPLEDGPESSSPNALHPTPTASLESVQTAPSRSSS